MKTKLLRTLSVLFGWLIWSFAVICIDLFFNIGIFPPLYLYAIGLLGFCLSLYGFYLWAKLKGYSSAYMLMGIITPISIPIFALMDNKNDKQLMNTQFINNNCKDCAYFYDASIFPPCSNRMTPNIENRYCYSFKANNRE